MELPSAGAYPNPQPAAQPWCTHSATERRGGKCLPSGACSWTQGGDGGNFDWSGCRFLSLGKLCCVLPVGQHGAQRLLDRKYRLPSCMLAKFLCAPKDDLFIIRPHQVLGGTYLRSDPREANRSL